MEQEVAIKELNAFLKGRYMGIHAYEHLIHHAQDAELKKTLQLIQQNHKQHAITVAERIQNLGGTPADDAGFIGSVQELFSNIKGYAQTKDDIVKTAIKSEEDYAVRLSEEIVKGDLDEESNVIVHHIINEDRKHTDTLKKLLH
ncbi:DUF2383 domain-containing protein [Ectobacillus sp. sgz5001026]|uniref:DUF2383 domain-containing protein n=1 Tax=Ectobacillus sp. sgz5001026 TaxID=3242473 RepID=UPI0036D3D310